MSSQFPNDLCDEEWFYHTLGHPSNFHHALGENEDCTEAVGIDCGVLPSNSSGVFSGTGRRPCSFLVGETGGGVDRIGVGEATPSDILDGVGGMTSFETIGRRLEAIVDGEVGGKWEGDLGVEGLTGAGRSCGRSARGRDAATGAREAGKVRGCHAKWVKK
jgi:hypothetical protein